MSYTERWRSIRHLRFRMKFHKNNKTHPWQDCDNCAQAVVDLISFGVFLIAFAAITLVLWRYHR